MRKQTHSLLLPAVSCHPWWGVKGVSKGESVGGTGGKMSLTYMTNTKERQGTQRSTGG